MTLAFAPAADWPLRLPRREGACEVERVRELARERIERDLAAAFAWYRLDAWLARSTAPQMGDAKPPRGATLAADLLACVVASDYWNARVPCPTGDAWRGGRKK